MSIFTQTSNGAVALKSTGSALVNFFFNVGAARDARKAVKAKGAKINPIPKGIVTNFEDAYLANKEVAAAILVWSRDIRHRGAGERNVFRGLVKELVKIDSELAEKVLRLIPSVGRYDDLQVFYGTVLQTQACQLWSDALMAGNAIAFKWADRSDKVLRTFMGFKNEGDFRKFISKGRAGSIVEAKICAKNWEAIEYGKLPSVAGARLAKAFKKNDTTRYTAFINDKNTTVNAKALFPHDVYRTFRYGGQADAASKIWNNLPKLEVAGNILVMADVSGSMQCPASGMIQCIDIAVSLGAYLAQNNTGRYRNQMLTFSDTPTLVSVPESKNIKEVFDFINRMEWGNSTNFEGAFEAILKDALKHKVPAKDMPSHILVLSDMQFNPSARGKDKTVHHKLKETYAKHGYELPNVVYWNLNAGGNYPTVNNEHGVALVSGFSPQVLTAVLTAKSFTPVDIMNEAIAPFLEMVRNGPKEELKKLASV